MRPGPHWLHTRKMPRKSHLPLFSGQSHRNPDLPPLQSSHSPVYINPSEWCCCLRRRSQHRQKIPCGVIRSQPSDLLDLIFISHRRTYAESFRPSHLQSLRSQSVYLRSPCIHFSLRTPSSPFSPPSASPSISSPVPPGRSSPSSPSVASPFSGTSSKNSSPSISARTYSPACR